MSIIFAFPNNKNGCKYANSIGYVVSKKVFTKFYLFKIYCICYSITMEHQYYGISKEK